MNRIRDFWSGLTLAQRLQCLVMGLILGTLFVFNDLNPRNRILEIPLWQVTVPVILSAILLGRLLLPVMLWAPSRTQQLLSISGFMIFGLSLYAGMQGFGRIILVHLCYTLAMWLDVSCWFWFSSEIQRLAARMLADPEITPPQDDGLTDDEE